MSLLASPIRKLRHSFVSGDFLGGGRHPHLTVELMSGASMGRLYVVIFGLLERFTDM